MKLVPLLVAALFAVGSATAQTVNYKVTTNDVSNPAKVIINLEPLHMELPLHSLAGINDMSFNVGGFGTVDPISRMGVDFGFRKSLFTLGQIGQDSFPQRTEWWVGGHLFLADKTVSKEMPVGLETDVRDNYGTNTRTTTVTYVNVPGDIRKLYGLRGGLFRRSTPRSLDDDLAPEMAFTFTRQNATGIYLGVLRRKLVNLVLDTDEYGLVSTASHGDDVYLDLLVVAGNNFINPLTEENVTDQTKDLLGSGFPLGARLGMNLFQIAPRAQTGKHFGLAGNFEMGYVPYGGFYLGASLAMTIIKK